MRRFETAARLSAWSRVAPGNDESAGKRRSGKTRKGNRALRTGLTQVAHAAARTKGTYLSALYQRLSGWQGSGHPMEIGGSPPSGAATASRCTPSLGRASCAPSWQRQSGSMTMPTSPQPLNL